MYVWKIRDIQILIFVCNAESHYTLVDLNNTLLCINTKVFDNFSECCKIWIFFNHNFLFFGKGTLQQCRVLWIDSIMVGEKGVVHKGSLNASPDKRLNSFLFFLLFSTAYTQHLCWVVEKIAISIKLHNLSRTIILLSKEMKSTWYTENKT